MSGTRTPGADEMGHLAPPDSHGPRGLPGPPAPPGPPAAAAVRPDFDEELAALYLAALSTPRFGESRLRRVVDTLGGLRNALAEPPEALAKEKGVTAERAALLQATVARERKGSLARVRAAVRSGLSVLTWEDPLYPPALLADAGGCAPLLFVEGTLPPQLGLPSDAVRACAIVGTRRATPQATGFARDLARGVATEGIVVVSGLALGIDGAAHRGALEAGLGQPRRPRSGGGYAYRWAHDAAVTPRPAPTVAVLGGGHGRLHPAEHAGLARQILAKGGAVVSLWPPETNPSRYSFLHRNRVISGLSRVVAVVEAGERSGTNNTVQHANEQGRTVLAVPAAPWSRSSVGCLRLIRDGAGVIIDHRDVLREFPELLPLPEVEHGEHEGGSWPQVRSTRGSSGAQLSEAGTPGTTVEPHDATGAVEPERVTHGLLVAAELRGVAELSLDALLTRLELPYDQLLAALLQLELAGAVELTAAGRYRWRGARF